MTNPRRTKVLSKGTYFYPNRTCPHLSGAKRRIKSKMAGELEIILTSGGGRDGHSLKSPEPNAVIPGSRKMPSGEILQAPRRHDGRWFASPGPCSWCNKRRVAESDNLGPDCCDLVGALSLAKLWPLMRTSEGGWDEFTCTACEYWA